MYLWLPVHVDSVCRRQIDLPLRALPPVGRRRSFHPFRGHDGGFKVPQTSFLFAATGLTDDCPFASKRFDLGRIGAFGDKDSDTRT
jgi:hypothetical protein